MKRYWTEDRIKTVKSLMETKTNNEICDIIGCSYVSLHSCMARYKIKRKKRTKKHIRKKKEIQYVLNENGCHICTSHARDKQGYCHIRRDGKTYKLHRWIYEQKHGTITRGKVIIHTCDNPPCILIEHLKCGSIIDNVMDRIQKRRTPYGEKHKSAKLNKKEVLEILKDKDSTHKELSKRYKVSSATISLIRGRKLWKHLQN